MLCVALCDSLQRSEEAVELSNFALTHLHQRMSRSRLSQTAMAFAPPQTLFWSV